MGGTISSSGELPHEAGSPSELLAATHLFVVHVVAIETTPWEREADGLEHQAARIRMRLERVLKGHLTVAPGATFILAAPRRREGALIVSDYHGFWSHVEILPGQDRLVISEGSGDDPATLMLEPSIRDLPNATLSADAVAAQTLEQRYAEALEARGVGAQGAIAAALAEVDHGRAVCHGLLGRYVWARLDPVYEADEALIRDGVLHIALAIDTTPDLRAALVEGLFTATLELAPTPARRAAVAGPLFRLLELPGGAISHDRLVQAVLFALVFGQDDQPISSATTIPDADERARLVAVLASVPGERSAALSTWLNRP